MESWHSWTGWLEGRPVTHWRQAFILGKLIGIKYLTITATIQTITNSHASEQYSGEPRLTAARRTKKTKRNLSLKNVRVKWITKILRKKNREGNEQINKQEGTVKRKDQSPIPQKCTWINRKVTPTSRGHNCSWTAQNFDKTFIKTKRKTENGGKNKHGLQGQMHELRQVLHPSNLEKSACSNVRAQTSYKKKTYSLSLSYLCTKIKKDTTAIWMMLGFWECDA